MVNKGSSLKILWDPFQELRGVDIDGIGNLEDSPRLVFIDEERGNRIVACDSVFTKGNSQTF